MTTIDAPRLDFTEHTEDNEQQKKVLRDPRDRIDAILVYILLSMANKKQEHPHSN